MKMTYREKLQLAIENEYKVNLILSCLACIVLMQQMLNSNYGISTVTAIIALGILFRCMKYFKMYLMKVHNLNTPKL